MRVLIHVDVKGVKQAKDIERALAQPDVKAFATAVGALERVGDDRARDRALAFVLDYFADPAHAHPRPAGGASMEFPGRAPKGKTR